ncbi:TetR/AcrR family transcriptional regulator [Nocardioides sambongensis]|uniref:TetR/AcrR family transcriptional regulator n=1 Tax=Nocardioides sambongensis TaxID=2589074 RepID=UPI0015E86BB5|nr:TetR/AcrR family transcriptional regulator [Nocardioides sambongensis]
MSITTHLSPREAKRYATARRLQRCALQLTVERGYDGWTMDDLATEAEVSRRTVFNYFEGKAQVVLGPIAELDPELIATFVAGGPTGDLVDDLVCLAQCATEEGSEDIDALPAVREAIIKDGRLLALVHERFETITEMLAEVLREREGSSFPAGRARLLLRLLLICLDDAVERAAADPSQSFPELLGAAVADARALFAR